MTYPQTKLSRDAITPDLQYAIDYYLAYSLYSLLFQAGLDVPLFNSVRGNIIYQGLPVSARCTAHFKHLKNHTNDLNIAK